MVDRRHNMMNVHTFFLLSRAFQTTFLSMKCFVVGYWYA